MKKAKHVHYAEWGRCWMDDWAKVRWKTSWLGRFKKHDHDLSTDRILILLMVKDTKISASAHGSELFAILQSNFNPFKNDSSYCWKQVWVNNERNCVCHTFRTNSKHDYTHWKYVCMKQANALSLTLYLWRNSMTMLVKEM